MKVQSESSRLSLEWREPLLLLLLRTGAALMGMNPGSRLPQQVKLVFSTSGSAPGGTANTEGEDE